MTAETIINAVRNRLGDSKKERWDDADLLLYVSLCQNDICMFTNFYRKSAGIIIEADKYIYDLPTDCVVVNRFEYADKLLPVETRNDVDKGQVTYPLILKDNLEFNKIEFKIGDGYDDLTSALVDTFGLVSDYAGLADEFGIVSEVIQETPQPLYEIWLYYTAVPPILTMVDDGQGNLSLPTDPLIVPDIWFQAFFHFVCAMALQDDNDANNIQRGELEAQKYDRILQRIKTVSSKSFTSNVKSKLVTKYRRT